MGTWLLATSVTVAPMRSETQRVRLFIDFLVEALGVDGNSNLGSQS
jgi:hypothetical protein